MTHTENLCAFARMCVCIATISLVAKLLNGEVATAALQESEEADASMLAHAYSLRISSARFTQLLNLLPPPC